LREDQQARITLICKKSLKLTVTFLKLEKFFEIDRQFTVKRPAHTPPSQILDQPLISDVHAEYPAVSVIAKLSLQIVRSLTE
jgi:hypothetical protein